MALPAEEDLLRYPHGQVNLGGGRLTQATTASFRYANGAQLVHTLNKSANGYVMGDENCTGSINTEVPSEGPEFDYIEAIRTGTPQKLQYEIPTLNLEITGIFTEASVDVAHGATVKYNLTFIGKLGKPVTTG